MKQNKRKRKINFIWFNPPFCTSVKTKISRKFIMLIEKHFNKENPLKKIFNRNTINISYSCMQNIGTIINGHNRKILQKKKEQKTNTKTCNCATKFECPLKDSKRSCRTESVIYEAKVKTKEETEHT